MKHFYRLLIAMIAATLFTNAASAQMAIRGYHLYSPSAFLRLQPAAGQKAPDLEIRTLQGKAISLDDYLGKTLIVIKGSYT